MVGMANSEEFDEAHVVHLAEYSEPIVSDYVGVELQLEIQAG
jgi:hypothetical protein